MSHGTSTALRRRFGDRSASGTMSTVRGLTARALVAVTMFVAASVLACHDSTTAPSIPGTAAGIAGRITVIVPNGSYAGQLKVETDPTSNSSGPKAIVTVTTSTTIFRLDRTQGDFRDFTPGQWVRVWFNGAVAESYPVQGTGATIVVDSAGVGVTK